MVLLRDAVLFFSVSGLSVVYFHQHGWKLYAKWKGRHYRKRYPLTRLEQKTTREEIDSW